MMYQNIIDPVLTILLTLAFIKTAITSIYECVREFLLAAPSDDITAAINEKINQIDLEYDILDKIFRLGKVGGKLIIEVDFLIEQNSELDSILMQDQLRNKLTSSLTELPYDKWININFIGDIKWADHLS